MNQRRLCRRERAIATQARSLRRHSTQALEELAGVAGTLSRGGKSSPRQRRLDDFLV